MQRAPGACRSPASLDGTISQKRKGDGDVSWGNLSAITALATAVHKSVRLNYTWFGDLILNQVNIHLCCLLSQPPQNHYCSGKQLTVQPVCGPCSAQAP